MKTKTFPKSRVCAVNVYPFFEKSLKTTIEFTSKHNISIGSVDGKKLLLNSFIKETTIGFDSISSSFPKVMFLSTQTANIKIKRFLMKYGHQLLEKLPVPYCGVYDENSPDLEMAALICLEQKRDKQNFAKTAARIQIKRGLDIRSIY